MLEALLDQVSASAKPLYRYGTKISTREVVLEIPILARNGPVNILWRMLHCFLVNEVTGRGNSKLGCHIVHYAVYVSSLVNSAVLMLHTHLSACFWQCVNSSVKDLSGERLTPNVCIPIELSTRGIGV